MNAVHVACVKGRTEVVHLLLSKATQNLQEVLNAKTKVSSYFMFYNVKSRYHSKTGQVDTSDVLCEGRPHGGSEIATGTR